MFWRGFKGYFIVISLMNIRQVSNALRCSLFVPEICLDVWLIVYLDVVVVVIAIYSTTITSHISVIAHHHHTTR